MAWDVLKDVKDVYKDEAFWLIILAIFCGLTFIFKNPLYGVIGGTMVSAIPLIIDRIFLPMLQEVSVSRVISRDVSSGLLLGRLLSGREIRIDLESLNHMFIIGMTRYGKTRLVLALISELIENYRPDEVKLAFSDAKAVSFNVFGRSQHLFLPLATSQEATENLINRVLEEMNRRKALFQDYHEQICTNIDEYHNLTGEQLPRIIVVFDEVADSVEQNSKAERDLTTLAKMGLAYGIHLVLVTQRPTKIGISHEITSQCQTIMCTYMKNSIEYGSVAKIPTSVYLKMTPTKGLFMVFSPDLAPTFRDINPEYEGWGFLMSNYMDNKLIEQVAIADSTHNLDLPDLESSIPTWGGSEDDKLYAIQCLEEKLGKVTKEDMKRYFDVGSRTARTWLDKYYGDR